MTTFSIPSLVPKHISPLHPLVQNSYSVFTAPINRAVQTVGDWLDNQVEGGMIYGPSRWGKSHAVNHWLQDLLSERYGGFIPLIVWSYTALGSSASASTMYSSILQAAKHPLASAKRGPVKILGLLVERCAELAFQGGGKFLVLVIDEAHDMTQRDWIWIVQLHSTLKVQNINLCVISVASLQFNDTPFGMTLTGGAHVAARFMLMQERYYGIRGIDELRHVLRGYDDGLFWPESPTVSYTEGVATQAWRDGFRLEQCDERLLAALIAALPENYAASHEFPMKTIAHCARHILLRIAGGALPEDVTSPQALADIIKLDGYHALMAVVSATAILSQRRRTK